MDAELAVEDTAYSPGVRRMLGVVGADAPFTHGREQMKALAGLEVTTKAVERTSEAIGADIAQPEQQEIQRAMQTGSSHGGWVNRFRSCSYRWTQPECRW